MMVDLGVVIGVVEWAKAVRAMDARRYFHERGLFFDFDDVPVCSACGRRVLLPGSPSCCYATQCRARNALKQRCESQPSSQAGTRKVVDSE